MVKNAAREKLWKRREVEKSKSDFPTSLGNPAKPSRDSHFSHSFGCCCFNDEQLSNRRGHFYCHEMGDISNALRHYALDLLATLATLLQNIVAHGLFPV
jgi:hypothetical protein